jgi:ATP-dependent Clp protease ATP-binding subunit ClpA
VFAFRRTKARLGQAEVLDPAEAGLDTPRSVTSNIGASLIAETSRSTTAENEEIIYQEMSSGVLDLLRKSLRPEFLNRIDERAVFRSLSLENIKDIVDLQFKELAHKMAEELFLLKISGIIIWRLPRG